MAWIVTYLSLCGCFGQGLGSRGKVRKSKEAEFCWRDCEKPVGLEKVVDCEKVVHCKNLVNIQK